MVLEKPDSMHAVVDESARRRTRVRGGREKKEGRRREDEPWTMLASDELLRTAEGTLVKPDVGLRKRGETCSAIHTLRRKRKVRERTHVDGETGRKEGRRSELVSSLPFMVPPSFTRIRSGLTSFPSNPRYPSMYALA